MRKNSIKKTALELLQNETNFTRKQMQFAVFKAQGKKGDELNTYREGYYSVAFQDWDRDGLIERIDRGLYKVTKLGKKYVQDPSTIKLIKLKARNQRLEKSNKRMHTQIWDLRISKRELDEENTNLRDEVDALRDEVDALREKARQFDVLKEAIQIFKNA